MIRRLLKSEKGLAFPLALAFIALALPLVVFALRLSSVLSIDSVVKTRIMKSSYSSMGGVQHGIWRLQYETGYALSLPLGVGVTYQITLNGIPVDVTVTKLSDPPPPAPVPPGLNNRAFSISKSVYPATQVPNTSTEYTYTALISNMTDTEKSISNLKDDFPTGLTYVTGSSSGITTSDPALVAGDLSWNLTGSEGSIPSFTNKTLQFKMQGSLAQGVYCNDIWVVPGGDKTRSGLTAKIIVGSPASTLCPGTAIRLAKTVSPQIAPANIATTFTYTLTFTSDGTDSSNVSKIVDLLPAGFNYVAGSIKIDDVSYSDPAIVLKNNGTQQQLTWSANPIMTIASGATRVVTFKTTAVVSANDYYNESSATVSGLNYDLYTWPTARVQVMGVVKLSATDGKSTTESEVWLGTNTVYISSWGVRSN